MCFFERAFAHASDCERAWRCVSEVGLMLPAPRNHRSFPNLTGSRSCGNTATTEAGAAAAALHPS